MPLYKTIEVSPTIKVYIWKIEESENDLAKGIELTKNSIKRLDGMRSDMHRKGYLSIRHLMAIAGYSDFDLYYNGSGKPLLKDGRHISITHSHQFTGIIVGQDDEVGIDIEMQREKIKRIAHKFTPLEAYNTITDPLKLMRKFTIVWGCKESLYKIYATDGLSFLKHIYIEDFNFTQKKLQGEVRYKGKLSIYTIEYLEFEGFTCVFAIKLTE